MDQAMQTLGIAVQMFFDPIVVVDRLHVSSTRIVQHRHAPPAGQLMFHSIDR